MAKPKEPEICGTRLSSLAQPDLEERVLRGLWAMEKRGEARRTEITLAGETWRIVASKAQEAQEAQEALLGMGLPHTMLRMVR